MAVTYSNREVLEHIGAAEDSQKVVEALKIATRALAFYAKEVNWKEDDWGCASVICHPDYGNGGKKARGAIKRIGKALAAPEQKSEAQR